LENHKNLLFEGKITKHNAVNSVILGTYALKPLRCLKFITLLLASIVGRNPVLNVLPVVFGW